MSARVKTTLRGERVGLFTMDPGQTTGITWSAPVLEGSTREVFAKHKIQGEQIWCADSSVDQILQERHGARQIANKYLECQAEWRALKIPYYLHFFGVEDFVLGPGTHSSERAGISPVRVTSLVQGMLDQDPVNWFGYSPSTCATTATNDRLRRWNMWIVGKPHCRSAARVAAVWVRENL